ncbi:hypothetical protein BB559_006896 [Furculomyces boomerangus]|uniref:Major facilitator superfamily (MFS) profile domain-containing protein n=2 Tax=Harpellales TaxID=61421 RepID=A0A2T9Y045_9FUNG|nr:hypothetical protein BB559_006896 [Furculomyces boomerangus]
MFALLDGGIIAAALVFGMIDGLHLSDLQQGNVTTFFFIFYVIFEAPANILMKKVKPHIWFTAIGIGFSVSTLMQRYARDGTDLTIIRSFLGFFEAGLIPGIVGYLGYWYTRSELSMRMVIFYLAIPIAGILGAPFSAALASIKIGNNLSYQNIFQFSGIITIISSISAFFLIHDYPDDAKFFSFEERQIILKRLDHEQGLASKTKGTVSEAFKFLLDWKLWVFSIIYFGISNAANVLSLFIPTIASSIGYSPTESAIIFMGAYVVGLIGMIIYVFYLSKKPFWVSITLFNLITAVSYYIALFAKNKILRLVFLILTGFGTAPATPIAIAWLSVNQGGVYKAMISSGIQLCFGDSSGIISPRLYETQYYPKYTNGSILFITALSASIALSLIMTVYFNRENKRRDDNPVDISHLSEEQQRKMYDKHPNFRYKV